MRDCALGQQSRQHATGSLFWREKLMYGSISYPSNIHPSQGQPALSKWRC